MGSQIEEARSSVTNVTSQIERMRGSRDAKLADIDGLQKEAQVRASLEGWSEWRGYIAIVLKRINSSKIMLIERRLTVMCVRLKYLDTYRARVHVDYGV